MLRDLNCIEPIITGLYFHTEPLFLTAKQTLLGQDPLIIKASQSHSDTPHSVGLLWTSDQPDTENST
jgi:hypothetical protein